MARDDTLGSSSPIERSSDEEEEGEEEEESLVRNRIHLPPSLPSRKNPSRYPGRHFPRESIRRKLAGDPPSRLYNENSFPRRNVGRSLTLYKKNYPPGLRSSEESSRRGGRKGVEEDNRNLSICFLNETASEDEEDESKTEEEFYKNLEIERVSSKTLVKGNISKKKGHVIIPINNARKRDFLKSSSSSSASSNSSSPIPSPTRKNPSNPKDPLSSFTERIKVIQDEAKRKLDEAKYVAAKTIANDRTQRRLNSPTCRILGLQYSKKLNRTILTDMNVAQLQVILNSFLSTIEGLNEDLVQYLILRDDLVIEQDSLLTDIEDITQSLRLDS